MQAFGMRANPILLPIDMAMYLLLSAYMTDGRKYVSKCNTIPAVKARFAIICKCDRNFLF